MLKMSKTFISVFIVKKYKNCIQPKSVSEPGYQDFSIKNYGKYIPHKQTQKTIKNKSSNNNSIYILYLFKRNHIAAILWATYTACIQVYFCIRLNGVVK